MDGVGMSGGPSPRNLAAKVIKGINSTWKGLENKNIRLMFILLTHLKERP